MMRWLVRGPPEQSGGRVCSVCVSWGFSKPGCVWREGPLVVDVVGCVGLGRGESLGDSRGEDSGAPLLE